MKKEIKIRYRGSVLGYLWSMLNPLLMMSVLTVVFSHIMRNNINNYPLYILSGVICWNMFSHSIHSGIQSIISHGYLLRKVSVPSWVFPTAYVSTACLNMTLALLPYLIIAFITGHRIQATIIQLPFIIILFALFIEGLVIALSSLNVLFRDISHVTEPVLQLVFYASPVIYSLELVPNKFHWLIQANPLFYFLEGFRSCLHIAPFLSLGHWTILSCLSLSSLLLGTTIYQKLEKQFIYHI